MSPFIPSWLHSNQSLALIPLIKLILLRSLMVPYCWSQWLILTTYITQILIIMHLMKKPQNMLSFTDMELLPNLIQPKGELDKFIVILRDFNCTFLSN